jgi:cytochrome d ubiquinol oxidase subunit II
MITFHGAIYLMHRTEGKIYERTKTAATFSGLLMLVGFTLAGVWLWMGIDGYVITSEVNTSALPNPLDKEVARQPGAWLANYSAYPWMIAAPVLAYVGALLGIMLARAGRTLCAFVTSSLSITGIIGTAGVSMFPFVMPSSSNMTSSLTVWDSVSSHLTLTVMFWSVVIFLPLIVVYTGWAYKVMAGKVTEAYIRENDHSAY